MKAAAQFAVVLVTVPNLRVARLLARGAVQAKLAACANLLPRIESHYWWQGKLESDGEVLIIFKTAKRSLAALEKFVLANHPYDTPEFVVLPVAGGTRRYLKWLAASVKS